MATPLSGLSASVTRILALTGFPKELKTKDIQSAFAEWENANGGFKIKWKDDTSLLIVFQDPSVAKRAYLTTLAFPPPILTSSSTGISATIKPYDGPDAQSVIQTVNSRGHQSNPSRSHSGRSASISVFPNSINGPGPGMNIHPQAHMRSGSTAANTHYRNGTQGGQSPLTTNGLHMGGNGGREPSPTLPSLPSHPTLNALISSSLGGGGDEVPSDPAIVATSLDGMNGGGLGPRIGDPGKRMLGAALGVRHPALGPRMVGQNGGDHGLHRAMGGLTVAE